MFKRNLIVSAAAILFATAAPSLAQVTAGAAVKDPQGGAVGTVEAVNGDAVVLKTDRHTVQFPASSFTKTDDGFLIGMTQAEVNAAVDQANAQAAQMIVVGASVKGSQGAVVGTIDALDTEFVTLKLAGGETLVKLPKAAVGATAEGPVIGMTQAELQSQVAGATAATETTPE